MSISLIRSTRKMYRLRRILPRASRGARVALDDRFREGRREASRKKATHGSTEQTSANLPLVNPLPASQLGSDSHAQFAKRIFGVLNLLSRHAQDLGRRSFTGRFAVLRHLGTNGKNTVG